MVLSFSMLHHDQLQWDWECENDWGGVECFNEIFGNNLSVICLVLKFDLRWSLTGDQWCVWTEGPGSAQSGISFHYSRTLIGSQLRLGSRQWDVEMISGHHDSQCSHSWSSGSVRTVMLISSILSSLLL